MLREEQTGKKTVVHCTTIKPNALHFRAERRNARAPRVWSAEPRSLKGKLSKEGVLSCPTSHRKARLFTQERELKRVHGRRSGNKETQSVNMPREISGSNSILKPQFRGERRK